MISRYPIDTVAITGESHNFRYLVQRQHDPSVPWLRKSIYQQRVEDVESETSRLNQSRPSSHQIEFNRIGLSLGESLKDGVLPSALARAGDLPERCNDKSFCTCEDAQVCRSTTSLTEQLKIKGVRCCLCRACCIDFCAVGIAARTIPSTRSEVAKW
jgi:hypothetical protein